MKRSLGLRAVSVFEAAKGLLVLIVGSGLLLLVHRDVQVAAERLVRRLRLDPASRYPRIFLHVVTHVTPGRLQLLSLGAFLYAVLRGIEAAGLWRGRRWAEWFGVATGLMWVPFEAASFVRRPRVEAFVALLLNIGIVAFLGFRLRVDREARAPRDKVSRV